MSGPGALVIGTRGSALARWQAAEIGRLLRAAHPGLEVSEKIVVTAGRSRADRPGHRSGRQGRLGQGDRGRSAPPATIDLAVHSMKDVPAELAPGLAIVAVPTRADPRDAIVSRDGSGLTALPPGSRLGTSSLRRVCQVRAARADLSVEILRGNVDTRLRKVAEGVVDAAVLASAGLDRLGFSARIAERLDATRMLPAIGQGALALEARAADARVVAAVPRARRSRQAEVTTAAERALLAGLGVGCRTPVAGHATLAEGRLTRRRSGRPPRRVRDDPRDRHRRAGRRGGAGRGAGAPAARARRRSDPARARGAVKRARALVCALRIVVKRGLQQPRAVAADGAAGAIGDGRRRGGGALAQRAAAAAVPRRRRGHSGGGGGGERLGDGRRRAAAGASGGRAALAATRRAHRRCLRSRATSRGPPAAAKTASNDLSVLQPRRCTNGVWQRMEVAPLPCFSCGSAGLRCQSYAQYCVVDDRRRAAGRVLLSLHRRSRPPACPRRRALACRARVS